MDRRTKILVFSFGGLIAYAILAKTVYPSWIIPLMTLDERIAAAQEQLDKLEAEQAKVDRAKMEYKRFAERTGSLDAVRVENDVRARLNDLIAKHRLEDQRVSANRATADRKSGLERVVVSITAVGSLESAVGFLTDLAELPHVARVGNVSISPASTSRQSKRADRVSLRVPLDVLVLPQQRILGQRLSETEFRQPPSVVRHSGRDFSDIWERTPFQEYVEYPPLVVQAGRDVEVEQGKPAQLTASATGGDGKYAIVWSGDHVDKLNTVNGPKVTVNTSDIDRYTFTVTVTDESEHTAFDSVSVNISEPKPEQVVTKETPAPPPPPPPPGPKRDPNGRNLQLAMALINHDNASRRDGFLVHNPTTNERLYFAEGDDFDGGTLVFVHPRGGLVRRLDGYFVYPIGARLDQDIKVEAAENYPDLLAVANRLRAEESAAAAAAAGAMGTETAPTGADAELTGPPADPNDPPAVTSVPTTGTTNAEATGGSEGAATAPAGAAPPSQPPAEAAPHEENSKPKVRPAQGNPSRGSRVRSKPRQ